MMTFSEINHLGLRVTKLLGILFYFWNNISLEGEFKCSVASPRAEKYVPFFILQKNHICICIYTQRFLTFFVLCTPLALW